MQVFVRHDTAGWAYHVKAKCRGNDWVTDWIPVLYLGRRTNIADAEVVPHALLLAVYFACHDFAAKWRPGASVRVPRKGNEPCHHAPSVSFAEAFAHVARDWFDWEIPAGHARVNLKLPPAPGTGPKNLPPRSILPEIRQRLEREVLEKMDAVKVHL